MKNVKMLRDELITTFDDLKKGVIGLREAKEHANLAGKILQSAKVQLEYNAYTKSKRRIKFLESDE